MGELRAHRAPRPVAATREALRWVPWWLAEVAGGGHRGRSAGSGGRRGLRTAQRGDAIPYAPHSVAMWGKNAEQFVQGHGNHTFGQETPWGTMWREGFKQMFLGTWFNSCTAIHIAEDWLSLPYMAPELPVWLKDGDGRKEGTVTGSPWGSRDFYNRWGGKVANQLWVKDRHLFRVVTHGRCTILTESFRDLVSTVIDYHYDDPLLLLKDPKEDPFAAKYAEATIAAMEGRERGDWIGPDLE